MNEKLIQHVEQLRRSGVIRKDKEIADKLGYTKSAVSGYLTGSVKASERFLEKFYDAYRDELGENQVHEPDTYYVRGRGNIIFVPLKAYGGFLQDYEDVKYVDTLQRFALPGILGEHYAFEVDGMSMHEWASPGDWAIAAPEEKLEYMIKGKPYVLQTTDGIIIKYFDKVDGVGLHKKAWFVSHNNSDEYPPVGIPLKSLKKIYFVTRIVKKV